MKRTASKKEMNKDSLGLFLLLVYVVITMITALFFGEKGVFWLPAITLAVILAIDPMKTLWRRGK